MNRRAFLIAPLAAAPVGALAADPAEQIHGVLMANRSTNYSHRIGVIYADRIEWFNATEFGWQKGEVVKLS